MLPTVPPGAIATADPAAGDPEGHVLRRPAVHLARLDDERPGRLELVQSQHPGAAAIAAFRDAWSRASVARSVLAAAVLPAATFTATSCCIVATAAR